LSHLPTDIKYCKGFAGKKFHYPLQISDFDAQVWGIKFWEGDENLRPVLKNRFGLFGS
jgi:hypothetical protein